MTKTKTKPATSSLTAHQLGKIYGLDQLAEDCGMPRVILIRTLRGHHSQEPVDKLAAIAAAPGWENIRPIVAVPDLDGWRRLWIDARAKFIADKLETDQ